LKKKKYIYKRKKNEKREREREKEKEIIKRMFIIILFAQEWKERTRQPKKSVMFCVMLAGTTLKKILSITIGDKLKHKVKLGFSFHDKKDGAI
jgi:hypothetical protein